jgi:Caspase domain
MDGTRSALIVASDDYADPALRRLRAPASDARALAAVLQDPGIGGFEVRTLLNRPAHVVSLELEEFFADRRPDDLLLVHFSCHGIKDEGGELYFAMANTLLRRLGSTAVAAEFVNRRMGRSRSRRIVLLLDCCYAGAFERGMTARAGTGMGIEVQLRGRGRAVITASSAMEYAFEGDELSDRGMATPSVFTSAIVEGLATGEADRDQDGLVALDELYDYVYDKVRRTTPHQTPGKWTFGVEGELVIARRARPVTTPSPLPRELHEAIASPLAAVRAAAVQELARLLQGAHAGLALAARLALEQLAGDDSRTVAAAATAALTGQQELARLGQAEGGQAGTAAAGEHDKAAITGTGDVPAGGHELAYVGPAPLSAAQAPAGAAAAGMPAETSTAGTSTSTPITPAPAAGPSATEAAPATPDSPRRVRVGVDAVSQALPGRLLVVTGRLAIAGVALLVAGLAPIMTTFSGQGSFGKSAKLPYSLYVAVVSVLALAAAACLLRPAGRRLVGTGFLLGAAVAAAWGLLLLLVDALHAGFFFGSGPGWWLGFAGLLVVVLAAGPAGFMLVRSPDVRLIRLRSHNWLAWLVVLLGAAGAYTLISYATSLWHIVHGQPAAWYMLPFAWAAIAALAMPACAAAAVPRSFSIALLTSWIGGGGAIITMSYPLDGYWGISNGHIIRFGILLLALLTVTVLLARAGPKATIEVPPAA